MASSDRNAAWKTQLVELFNNTPSNSDKTIAQNETLLNKCIMLCGHFSLTPKELASKWEAYSVNNKLSLNGQQEFSKALDRFKTSLEVEKVKKAKQEKKPAQARGGKKKGNDDALLDLYRDLGTDVTKEDLKKAALDFEEEERKKEFERRKQKQQQTSAPMDVDTGSGAPEAPVVSQNSGEHITQYNKQLALDYEPADSKIDIPIELLPNTSEIAQRYRFMNDRIKNRSNAFDDRLERFSEALVQEFKLEEPSPAFAASQDQVVAVGRICCEVEGRINESSVVLEAARENTHDRVKLLLRDLQSYSLFPGQMVAVEGSNPSGKLLVATKIHDGFRLPNVANIKSEEIYGEAQSPFSIMFAAGPWMLSHTYDYEPIQEILKVVDERTKVLVLLGPFIDAQDPRIQKCETLDYTFEELFKQQVYDKLLKAPAHLKIVLVPSVNDVFHDAVFPQPPFNAGDLGIQRDKRVHLLPNPCIFKVAGVTFGVTATDVVRHLSAEDTEKKVDKTVDRMSTLCEHIIKQQNFYPLFPAHTSVNLDSTHIRALEFPFTPDILVLPSVLPHFIKNVKNTLCINPGLASKGKMLGTFSKITIHPPGQDKAAVSARTRADVIRL